MENRGKKPVRGGWQWWSPLLCLLLLLCWTGRPIGVESPRHVDGAFDSARAIGRLAVLLGDQRPHPVDTPANDAVLGRLLAQIRQLGFTPEVREGFACSDFRAGQLYCARPRNVRFWITPPGDDAVMLTAHYDSVPAGPGAADDGMGVAVALEVAHLLKGQRFDRPVLVLITDGEEAGLVGAAAFAADDPLARRIGAVVNLEARGTTGTANMFQMSTPNGHDVAAVAAGGIHSSANALATNLYQMLPNDTDLTMLLPLGVDAANYAIIGGGMRYHTPIDDLAHLDRQSVGQMGESTLAAVRGFAATGHGGTEGQSVFTDLFQRWLLVLPQLAAALCVGIGVVGALVAFARTGPGRPVRTALAPLLALMAGVAAAWGMAALIGWWRPESAYGTAWPVALRFLYAVAALSGATAVLWALRIDNGRRLAAATWFWIGVLVLGAYAFMPGLTTLAAWPMLFVAAAGLVALSARSRFLVPWMLALAGLLFLCILLPIVGGLEEALFVEHAAPATAFLVFAFLCLMPGGARMRWAALGCALLLVPGVIAAAVVPAYTRDAPRHLNIVHEDADDGASFLAQDSGALPPAMRAAAAFGTAPDDKGNWRAPAPRLAEAGRGNLEIVSDMVRNGVRTVRMIAQAPDADRQELLIEKGEAIRSIAVNGAVSRPAAPLFYFTCAGRACRRVDIAMEIATGQPLPEIRWRRTWYGAGQAARPILAARPDNARPVHMGDRRVVVRAVPLEAR